MIYVQQSIHHRFNSFRRDARILNAGCRRSLGANQTEANAVGNLLVSDASRLQIEKTWEMSEVRHDTQA